MSKLPCSSALPVWSGYKKEGHDSGQPCQTYICRPNLAHGTIQFAPQVAGLTPWHQPQPHMLHPMRGLDLALCELKATPALCAMCMPQAMDTVSPRAAGQSVGTGHVFHVAPHWTWSQCTGLVGKVLHGACTLCQPPVPPAVHTVSPALHATCSKCWPLGLLHPRSPGLAWGMHCPWHPSWIQ